MIPDHLSFRRLKRSVRIEQVLADQGWLGQLRRRGTCLVGPCPIHHGDNPNAFVVHRERNLWHCFTACDAGGDIVELARRLQKGSYSKAAAYLASLAATPSPELSTPPPPPPRPFRPFTKRLPLDPTTPWLKRKGIRAQTARRFEVGAFYGKGMLDGCIAVRIFDPQGQPLGYAGRRIDPAEAQRHGKWKLPPGLPRNSLLYGYHQAHHLLHRGVVLVECPWGVLRLAQLHIPAVALLGTHLSGPQKARLEQLPVVVLLMDGDSAGRKAVSSIRRRLPRTSVIDLPDGLDPDDLTDQELEKVRSHLLF